MRFSFFLLLAGLSASLATAGPVPPELAAALEALHTDAPRGWAFTQVTEAGERRRTERFQPLGPEPARWQLLAVDGRPPTADELETYRKQQVLRAGGGTAPNVKQQIDRATCEPVSDDGTRASWRFALQPEHEDDAWAEHMVATFTLHRPSGAIERVELATREAFSPGFATKVDEARTVMVYTLPTADRPALLQEITVQMRGRAWVFRSLDSQMTVRYSDYAYVGRRPN